MFENLGTLSIAAITAVPSYYLLSRWVEGGQFTKSNIRIDGKVVIITGSNSGIGRETALDLAERGAKVYMACRDMTKANHARDEIIRQTGNKSVFTMSLDLSSFESIRNFVDEFKEHETKLNILINNAGVMALRERQLTKDGLEMQIGTNHFGHFLLTNLLLDLLKTSAPARIINVSSIGHKWTRLNREDLQLERSYNGWTSYFQSKLANVLFTRELAKQLKGTKVTVNSLHPGAVRTEIGRNLGVMQYLFVPFQMFVKSTKSGAQTSIMLAVDPDVENVSGKYFADCAVVEESKAAQSDEAGIWLWKVSERLTKLDQ